MRILLVLVVFLFALSLKAQKLTKPIFNQKTFSKFSMVDSLFKKTDNDFLDRILDFKTDNSFITQSNRKMPIFKPDYQTSMPVYNVDATKIFFLKVYPTNKD